MITFMQYLKESSIKIPLPSSRQQTDYTCGPTALRSIAKYYGKDLGNEKQFAELCDAGKNKGSHPEKIAEAARKLGFDAKVKQNMTLKELFSYMKRKMPVIVAIQAWSNSDNKKEAMKGYKELKDGHYVVVIGYDKENIYFEDPSIKATRPYLAKKEFLKRWIDKEAYIKNPVVKRLGIIIREKAPKKIKPEHINKTQRLP